MIRIVRTTKNLNDKGSTLYTKAITKKCIERGINFEIIEIYSQQEMDNLSGTDKPTLILEPCEFKKPKKFNNLEKNCTAKVLAWMCDSLKGSIIPKSYEDNHKSKSTTIGNNVVIVNRSELIGRPLINMLLDKDFTVTVAHSKTDSCALQRHINNADIVVFATGSDMSIYDCKDKVVLDVSNDYTKTKSKSCLIYYSMAQIGALTVDEMLDGLQ